MRIPRHRVRFQRIIIIERRRNAAERSPDKSIIVRHIRFRGVAVFGKSYRYGVFCVVYVGERHFHAGKSAAVRIIRRERNHGLIFAQPFQIDHAVIREARVGRRRVEKNPLFGNAGSFHVGMIGKTRAARQPGFIRNKRSQPRFRRNLYLLFHCFALYFGR